jgi:hypothetical protein
MYQIENIISQKGELIKCTNWLGYKFSNSEKESNFLIVGTSEGNLKFFTETGELIYDQQFNTSPILNIKVDSNNILVIYTRVIVKIEMSSLIAYLEDYKTNESSFKYKKWFLKGQNKVNDAILCNEGLKSILDIYKSKSSDVLIGVGSNPIISSYTTKEDDEGFLSASRIATQVASKVTNAVYSFAKRFFFKFYK